MLITSICPGIAPEWLLCSLFLYKKFGLGWQTALTVNIMTHLAVETLMPSPPPGIYGYLEHFLPTGVGFCDFASSATIGWEGG